MNTQAKHVLLLGEDPGGDSISNPIIPLTLVKVHDQPIREPTKPIGFTDAINALQNKGYALAERLCEGGIHQARLVTI